MAGITHWSTGKAYKPGDPDYDKVRIENLEHTVTELVQELGDVQHRLSKLDGEDLHWPGDTYEPRHTTPA
jgi:hypothetical protein